eukprot:gene7547-9279_t
MLLAPPKKKEDTSNNTNNSGSGGGTTNTNNNNKQIKAKSEYKLPKDIGAGLLKFCLTHTDSPNLKETVLPADRDPKDYDWLRQAFDNLEDDAKRMKKILELIEKPDVTTEQIITSLEKLVFFIEDLDNSGDFIKIGGLPVLVKLIENKNQEIRSTATGALTILSQNDDNIQTYFKSIGILKLAIRQLNHETVPICREKYLTLISSFVGYDLKSLDTETLDIIVQLVTSFLSPTVDLFIGTTNDEGGQGQGKEGQEGQEEKKYSITNSINGMAKAIHLLNKIILSQPELKEKCGVEYGILDALVQIIRGFNHISKSGVTTYDENPVHINMVEKAEKCLLDLLTGSSKNIIHVETLNLVPEIDSRLNLLSKHPNILDQYQEEFNILKSIEKMLISAERRKSNSNPTSPNLSHNSPYSIRPSKSSSTNTMLSPRRKKFSISITSDFEDQSPSISSSDSLSSSSESEFSDHDEDGVLNSIHRHHHHHLLQYSSNVNSSSNSYNSGSNQSSDNESVSSPSNNHNDQEFVIYPRFGNPDRSVSSSSNLNSPYLVSLNKFKSLTLYDNYPNISGGGSSKYLSTSSPNFSTYSSSASHHNSTFKGLKKFIYMTHFPEEVEFKILSHLSPMDIINFSMTSKHYYRIANDRTLWREYCHLKNWKNSFVFDPKFDYKLYFFEKLSLTAPNCAKWRSPKFYGHAPSKRFKHTATCVGRKIVFIGGQETDTKRFNDIIYFDIDTQTFSSPSIKGDRVPNFSRHTSSLVGDKIYVFGGFDGHGTNFDLAVYHTRSRVWTNIPKTFLRGQSPISRTNHASAVVGSNVYIFGGNNNNEFGHYQVLGDLHVLNTESMTWSQPEVTGDKPCARSGHCLTAIGTKLYLFGGGVWNETNGWIEKFNDIHVFDTERNHWTKPVTKGDVQTSTFAISFNIGRYLFIFGGGSKPRHCVTNEIYALDTESFFWDVPSIEEPRPPARDMGTACVAGGDVYFMGGYAGNPIDYFNKLKFNFKILSNIAKNPNFSSISDYDGFGNHDFNNQGNSFM